MTTLKTLKDIASNPILKDVGTDCLQTTLLVLRAEAIKWAKNYLTKVKAILKPKHFSLEDHKEYWIAMVDEDADERWDDQALVYFGSFSAVMLLFDLTEEDLM